MIHKRSMKRSQRNETHHDRDEIHHRGKLSEYADQPPTLVSVQDSALVLTPLRLFEGLPSAPAHGLAEVSALMTLSQPSLARSAHINSRKLLRSFLTSNCKEFGQHLVASFRQMLPPRERIRTS